MINQEAMKPTKKKIWLIGPYGSIPSESWRSYCFGIIGTKLSEVDYEVIWWTSSFSHHFKRQRCNDWRDIDVQDGFKIRLVPTPGYKSNVGFGRIWRDLIFGFKVHVSGLRHPKPDLVIYCESPLNCGLGGYSVARRHSVPVVFYQMDLWPELFVHALPFWLRLIGNLVMSPIYLVRRHVYRRLDGIIALAKPYLEAPLTEVPALRSRKHALVYNGINVEEMRTNMNNGRAPECLPSKSNGELWGIFAGSLGPSYDILALIKAARTLREMDMPIKIIIAGDGPYRHQVEEAAANPSMFNLYYAGKLSPSELASVYGKCDVGFCAYTAQSNVEMPDKIYDYTAAGLAVLNSLRGEVKEVVASRNVGLQYRAGDVSEIVDRLLQLHSSPDRLAEMKRASFALGLEYDQSVQYKKVVQLVDDLIYGGKPSHSGIVD